MSKTTNIMNLSREWQLERLDPNLLVLDTCQYSIDDGPWSVAMPVVQARNEIFAALKLDEVQGYQPWYLLKEGMYPAPMPVALRYCIDSLVELENAGLVVEHLGLWEVTANGVAIAAEPTGWLWDRDFGTCELGPALRAGRNIIELRSTLQQNLEIEDIFVRGAFAVVLEDGIRPVITAETPVSGAGDWTERGYPFYTGAMRYTQQVELESELSPGAQLRLPRIAGACALVQFNNHEPKWVAWEPWEVPIDGQLHAGANRISIDVYTSLRNALGPLHHSDANSLTWVGPDEFEQGDHWSDAYVLMPQGLMGEVVLID